jgi:hypothetical protein
LQMRERFLPGGKDAHAKAAAHSEERARAWLTQVIADYPTTPAAKVAREMLDRLDAERPATTKP